MSDASSDPGSDLTPAPAADGEGGGLAAAGTPQRPSGASLPAVTPGADTVPASASGAAATKGPLSFLSGALTSAALAWLALSLSQRVVAYYTLHPPHYEARVAQSIATALKTLIVGMCFLATFSFAFVGLGLLLVFLRSLAGARRDSPA